MSFYPAVYGMETVVICTFISTYKAIGATIMHYYTNAMKKESGKLS